MHCLAGVILVVLGSATAQNVTLSADPVAAVWSPVEPNSVKIEFQARLTLKNVGDQPILLLTAERPAVVGVYIGQAEDFDPSSSIVAQYRGPSVDTGKQWTDLAVRLKDSPLRTSGLSVLSAGESMALTAQVVIYLPESKRESTGRARSDMPFKELLEQKKLWISVLVDIWPQNLERAGGAESLSKHVAATRSGAGELLIEPLLSSPALFDLRATSK